MEEQCDNGQYVECLICGEKMVVITWSHLRTHGLTTTDYMLMFPGEPMQGRQYIEEHAELVSDFMSWWWNSKEGIERRKALEGNYRGQLR